jgi:hypothetical protein
VSAGVRRLLRCRAWFGALLRVESWFETSCLNEEVHKGPADLQRQISERDKRSNVPLVAPETNMLHLD